MAKTKEEIIQYLKSKNWGKMWIDNIHLNSTYVIPNDLDRHLEKMRLEIRNYCRSKG